MKTLAAAIAVLALAACTTETPLATPTPTAATDIVREAYGVKPTREPGPAAQDLLVLFDCEDLLEEHRILSCHDEDGAIQRMARGMNDHERLSWAVAELEVAYAISTCKALAAS